MNASLARVVLVTLVAVPLASAGPSPPSWVWEGTTTAGDVDRYGWLLGLTCFYGVAPLAYRLTLHEPQPGDSAALAAFAFLAEEPAGASLATGEDPVAETETYGSKFCGVDILVVGLTIVGTRAYTLEFFWG